MAVTTYDMERPAVKPVAAPVHVVCHGGQLAAGLPAARHQTASIPAIAGAGKPWTTGYGRSRRFIGLMNDRSARHLGSTST